jgi:cbb3-type cytochrome oxidase maturation protein
MAWIVFVILVFGAIGGAIYWAARSGQFKDQDRARYLPLMSGIPEEPDEKDNKRIKNKKN